MLEFVLDGLAAGLTYALLAAALALARVAWPGLDRRPGGRPGAGIAAADDARLRAVAAMLGALALVWVCRRGFGAVAVVLPAAPLLAWLLPPVLLAALAWAWWASRPGAVWRAQAERPAAAFELGLPLGRAGLLGLAAAAALGAAAALPASGTVLTPVVAPEVKALAAALAAGHPLGAAALGLLAGLAEGLAAAVAGAASAAAGWWVQAAGYAVLLAFLLAPAAGRGGRRWPDEGVAGG